MNLDHKESCIINDSILEPYYSAKIPALSKVKKSLPRVEICKAVKNPVEELTFSKIWDDVQRLYKLG